MAVLHLSFTIKRMITKQIRQGIPVTGFFAASLKNKSLFS
jgi:hypothetical protein